MNKRHQAHKPVKKCNYWGPIVETEWSTGSNCVIVPNFEAIVPTVTEIRRYFDFSRWQPPPSWIFKFLKFLTAGRLNRAELRRREKFGRNRWNCGRDMAIFRFFPRWRPSGFVTCEFGPRRAFGGLYRCTKFGWNRCSRFDNVHVFDFTNLAWKRLFTPPKLGALGDFTP